MISIRVVLWDQHLYRVVHLSLMTSVPLLSYRRRRSFVALKSLTEDIGRGIRTSVEFPKFNRLESRTRSSQLYLVVE